MSAAKLPPHFLCIGAHKSGTTWLYENLRRHPGIWLPPVKEVHFFDGMPGLPKIAQRLNQAIAESIASGRIGDPEMLDYLRKYVLDQPKDVAWYRRLFDSAGGRIAGDITPAYAALPEATVAKVREILPDCRIIFIMRNPIDRAWSHFRFNAGTYKFDLAALEFENFRRHVDSPASESRTAYVRTMATWERHYPPDRILYGFYDDVQSNPDALLSSVCRLLELPFDPEAFAESRAAIVRKSVEMEIPSGLRSYLARKYHGEIAALRARFGSHTERWLADCERWLKAAGEAASPPPALG